MIDVGQPISRGDYWLKTIDRFQMLRWNIFQGSTDGVFVRKWKEHIYKVVEAIRVISIVTQR